MSTSDAGRAGQVAIIIFAVCASIGLTYLATSQQWINAKPAESTAAQPAKPFFKSLDKLVISFGGYRTQRYMLLEIALVSRNPLLDTQIKDVEPMIQNAILQYFSPLSFEDARNETQNVELLQTRLLEKVKRSAESYGLTLAVDKLLLTKIVVQ